MADGTETVEAPAATSNPALDTLEADLAGGVPPTPEATPEPTPAPQATPEPAATPEPQNLEAQPSPNDGKVEQAPVAGQDGEGSKSQEGQPGPSEEQAPAVTLDQIKASMSTSQTEEHTLESLTRNYQASSKEAREKAAELKSLGELLEEQGVKVAKESDGTLQLVRSETTADPIDWDHATDPVKTKFAEMVSNEAEPSEMFDYLAGIVGRPQPQPTADRVVEPISAERTSQAYEAVSNMLPDVHGKIAENKELIEWRLSDAPKEVQEAFHAAPEFMLQLLNAEASAHQVALQRKAEAAEAKRKEVEAEAQRAEGLSGSPDGGTPSLDGGATDNPLTEIVNA